MTHILHCFDETKVTFSPGNYCNITVKSFKFTFYVGNENVCYVKLITDSLYVYRDHSKKHTVRAQLK